MDIPENLFLAKYSAGHLNVEDIIAYVDEKLAAGFYSDRYIDILDASPRDWDEVSYLFELLMDEENTKVPSEEDAVWTILKYHLELIASDKLEPYLQFTKLLEDIQFYDCSENTKQYYGDSIGIHYLYAMYHHDCATKDEINRMIFKESRKWLDKYSANH